MCVSVSKCSRVFLCTFFYAGISAPKVFYIRLHARTSLEFDQWLGDFWDLDRSMELESFIKRNVQYRSSLRWKPRVCCVFNQLVLKDVLGCIARCTLASSAFVGALGSVLTPAHPPNLEVFYHILWLHFLYYVLRVISLYLSSDYFFLPFFLARECIYVCLYVVTAGVYAHPRYFLQRNVWIFCYKLIKNFTAGSHTKLLEILGQNTDEVLTAINCPQLVHFAFCLLAVTSATL